ncbi:MAG: putative DNA-binding domain-containing protein [Xanthomonadales bacterium]|nr:putative DNA-binding domain-containing protein [Xanthomonadales bacterium]
MAESGGIGAAQLRFGAHLRDPDAVAAPAHIAPRRMAVYRDLVFDNLFDLLGGNFPVLRSLGDADAWRARVRAFLREHRSQTPLFPEIAREFIRFLEARAGAEPDLPFLAELAHYEWSELALAIDEADIAAVAHDPDGDVIDGIPVVSPLARLLAYRFPVHRIGPAFQPAKAPPNPTLILLVRDRADAVGFLEVEPMAALLFEQLAGNATRSGRACLDAVLGTLGRARDDALRASGLHLLEQLRRRDVLLGTR